MQLNEENNNLDPQDTPETVIHSNYVAGVDPFESKDAEEEELDETEDTEEPLVIASNWLEEEDLDTDRKEAEGWDSVILEEVETAEEEEDTDDPGDGDDAVISL